NLDLLKKGTIADIAAIVRCLYNRSKVKELPILERKLYDQAKKLLEDEISIAMGMDVKEVESKIHLKLEPPGSQPKIKHIIDDFDDEDDDLMNDVSSSKKDKDDSRDDEEDDSDDAADSDDSGDFDDSDDDEF
ncbi:MAG: CarD family transcriptional regulator, partial [Treponema sp.]|nr:CarD family transcriptional regulator [Treponema sp.]